MLTSKGSELLTKAILQRITGEKLKFKLEVSDLAGKKFLIRPYCVEKFIMGNHISIGFQADIGKNTEIHIKHLGAWMKDKGKYYKVSGRTEDFGHKEIKAKWTFSYYLGFVLEEK